MSSFSAMSARHIELLMAVVKNLKATDVEWETVATDANFKTAKYARDEYNKILKRLQIAPPTSNDKDTAAEDGAPATTLPAANVLKTRKRKAASEKTPAKAKKVKKTEAAVKDTEDDEEIKVKPEPKGDDGTGEVQDEDAFF